MDDDWREQVLAIIDSEPAMRAPFNYLIGQVMKETKGQADPKAVRLILVKVMYEPAINSVLEELEQEGVNVRS